MMVGMPATPLRAIRIDDELWSAATRATRKNHDTISDVVRRALEDYVDQHKENP